MALADRSIFDLHGSHPVAYAHNRHITRRDGLQPSPQFCDLFTWTDCVATIGPLCTKTDALACMIKRKAKKQPNIIIYNLDAWIGACSAHPNRLHGPCQPTDRTFRGRRMPTSQPAQAPSSALACPSRPTTDSFHSIRSTHTPPSIDSSPPGPLIRVL